MANKAINEIAHLYPNAEVTFIDGDYKFVLTPFTDLPPEHEKELRLTRIQTDMLIKSKRIPMLMPDQFLIALKYNYDIFGLIESKQVVNKNA